MLPRKNNEYEKEAATSITILFIHTNNLRKGKTKFIIKKVWAKC